MREKEKEKEKESEVSRRHQQGDNPTKEMTSSDPKERRGEETMGRQGEESHRER